MRNPLAILATLLLAGLGACSDKSKQATDGGSPVGAGSAAGTKTQP